MGWDVKYIRYQWSAAQNTVVGLKVSPSELNILEQYAQILHEQQIQKDTKMGVNRRLLEMPEFGLPIKNATYSYIVEYNYSWVSNELLIRDKDSSNKQP